MKLNKIKFVLPFLLLGSQGCNDVLDLEPLDIISDAVVWEDPNLIDAYLADLYYRVDFIELRGNLAEQTSFAMIASMGGEGRSFGAHHPSYIASTNVITASGVEGELDYWKYNNIRDCNYFIQQLQKSPLDEDVIVQRTAEARFLRAYMYFQMVIRF